MKAEEILDYTFMATAIFAMACLVIYIPRMVAWFGAVKPQKKLENSKKNKIAVIIPAKNEGKIIDDIFSSLLNQTYPREQFDIHVVVKDSDDITIQKTREIGGYAYVASNQNCKGDALDYVIKKILVEKPNVYDSYFIIDADCLLSGKCLEEMNNAMASGAMVLQAKKVVKNYLSKNPKANTLASECNGLIWSMIDDLGNRFKADHNLTGMTIGTGLMLTNQLIKEFGGWPYRSTLTEDMELMNDCAVKGYSTFYYSYAIVYVEEATSLHVTNIRRTRWLTGLIDSKAIYNEALMKKSMQPENKWNIYFVTALWPVFYYIGSLTVLTILNLGFFAALLLKKNPCMWRALLYSGIGFAAIYISFLVLTGACMLVDRKNIRLSFVQKVVLLFVHPLFYMGYIPIIANAFLKRNTDSWEAIERVDLEDEDYVKDIEEDECYAVGYFKKNRRM